MDPHVCRSKITKFLNEELVPEGSAFTDGTSLFREQLLDSINLSELIGFVEGEFNIRIQPMEIVFENLDTVDNLVLFLQRKLAIGT